MNEEIHKYIEERSTPLCDFCCQNEATFYYPSSASPIRDEITRADGQVIVIEEGDSGWGACNDCAPFVDSKDIPSLVQHVVTIGKATLSLPPFIASLLLRSLYERVIPNLREKEPVKCGGGHFYAEGSPEFVDIIREQRKKMMGDK